LAARTGRGPVHSFRRASTASGIPAAYEKTVALLRYAIFVALGPAMPVPVSGPESSTSLQSK
jgi:hypothetical protein